MRHHRIHTNEPLEPGQTVILPGGTAHYLSRVLRVVAGQRVVLFNGDGMDYATDIVGFGHDEVCLIVDNAVPARAESPLNLTLVQAVSRGERMDLTLQKATELGVTAFWPVFTARTEVRLTSDKAERRMEHWRRVIISACEQCGRACVPTLHEPAGLLPWMRTKTLASRLVLEPGAPRSLAGSSLVRAVELLVGPEGGFEDVELELLEQNGVAQVSLGPRILRTETAGPAAVAILQALAGDLV
ncbi:MAG: 16S rRNA (uracil(1498)-N(3))-methyltransferase [Lysobacterales bacterium]